MASAMLMAGSMRMSFWFPSNCSEASIAPVQLPARTEGFYPFTCLAHSAIWRASGSKFSVDGVPLLSAEPR